MRATILRTATLASLLLGLPLAPGPSAGAVGRQPSVPGSTWGVVSSMPQDLYGAAAASNGTYAYAAGGYSSPASSKSSVL